MYNTFEYLKNIFDHLCEYVSIARSEERAHVDNLRQVDDKLVVYEVGVELRAEEVGRRFLVRAQTEQDKKEFV